MKIAIANDHRGYKLKKKLIKYLENLCHVLSVSRNIYSRETGKPLLSLSGLKIIQ